MNDTNETTDKTTGGNDCRQPLVGMPLAQLQEVVASLGLPRFNAAQIARWLYVARATDIEQMTDLSKTARQKLAQGYTVGRQAPLSAQRSTDGTVKYLFDSGCGLDVEAVYIPDKDLSLIHI